MTTELRWYLPDPGMLQSIVIEDLVARLQTYLYFSADDGEVSPDNEVDCADVVAWLCEDMQRVGLAPIQVAEALTQIDEEGSDNE